MARLASLLVVCAVLAGCGAGVRAGPVQRSPSPVAHARGGRPAHIAVIVMENEEYRDVIGAPFLGALARRSAVAGSAYAITHPSLPNYLALAAGATFGVSSDCTDCLISGQASIADQLQRAGLSWRAYMEDLPHPCFRDSGAGGYAQKHDPFIYFTQIRSGPSCSSIVPLSRLAGDEHALPRFVWITPNLCQDMHDCDVATGDRFLAGLVPPLLRALGPRGLLILTWDEGTSDDGCCRLAAGGHVATILAGGLARPGARLTTPTDHYSVLQLIEDLLGLPRLRGAACACTPTLAPLLRPSLARK